MIKEAPLTGRVRHCSLRRVPEEAQRGQRALDRLCAGYERALDRDGIAGERQSHTGDACGDVVGCGVVGNQPVLGVGFLPEISKGVPLERLKLIVAVSWGGTPGRALLRSHAGASSTVRPATP